MYTKPRLNNQQITHPSLTLTGVTIYHLNVTIVQCDGLVIVVAGVVVAVGVSVTMASTVRVAVSTATVRVTMSSMIKGIDAHQVDQQTQDGDNEQSLVLDLRRLNESLHALRQDEEGYEQQEKAVDKACQHLSSHIAVRELVVGLPLGDNRGGQSRQEARAVEEHVERVGDQA